MYELFILGELMTGDKHGYLLQDILKNAVGPFRQISSGTLYPLLSRLVENGLIRQLADEGKEGARPRKLYQLTETGRQRFHELMAQPLEHNAEAELLFHFKMVYFLYVPKDVRLACLEQYLKYLQINLHYITGFESKILLYKPEPEKERVQLLRVIDHRKHVGAAGIRWVEEEIERIKSSGE
ncbi:PadR family transcriptional regulator [Paenibacillus alkalitolerans]|uniref:PadR family transcriptional regulator n=1 Tax=Paenibacillus alkalitolerans TaxID=2799335 RepID=UPI0018F78085|nr:PadR family transcriptional regulator [Paenibacillus alkalitolerans]